MTVNRRAPGVPSPTPTQLLLVAIVSGAIAMLGVVLDTAWHRTIGRDSFFMAPHLLMYGGGGGVLGAALAGLRWGTARFGFGLSAAGIIAIVVSAPVDAWWHATFGKDALIWSPPHLLLHFGAGMAALGLVFAAAEHRVPRVLMFLFFIDLVHRGQYVLGHYTMLPHTRTPDLYPFLVALLVPVVLVAAARALGPWAATLLCLAYTGVALLTDVLLRLADLERYTLTPILAVPAVVLSLVFWRAGRQRHRAWLAAAAGLAFTVVFVAMEVAWMHAVVGRPWPLARVLAGLPRALLTGALGGWTGWVAGGFLRIATHESDATREFGSRARARGVLGVALALMGAGLFAAYQPQRFGPPMTVDELRLVPLAAFPYQEAVFWSAMFAGGWPLGPRVETESEGIIEDLPVPIGPAWCAPTAAALDAVLPATRFAMEVNGASVDLTRYPLVRVQLRDGERCAWVGVASTFQRASENRFVYTIERVATAGEPAQTRVELLVIFKDP